jgi:hypothetical protein
MIIDSADVVEGKARRPSFGPKEKYARLVHETPSTAIPLFPEKYFLTFEYRAKISWSQSSVGRKKRAAGD